MPKSTSNLTNPPINWEIPSDLRMLGMTRASTESVYRLVLSLTGKEKTGKDHFCYGAPDPIGMINVDIGTEGVIQKFAHRRIAISHHAPPRDVIQMFDKGKDAAKILAHYTKEWKKINDVYDKLLNSKAIRTIVINTASEIFDAMKLVRFEGKLNMKPHHYTKVNDEYRAWVRQIYNTDKNLILVHKVKKQYVDTGKDKDGNTMSGWSGEYERTGYSDTAFLVQANIETYYKDRDPDDEESKGVFGIHVTDCRQNADIRGEDFEGPMCSFPFLASMVFPETDEDYWK